MNLVIVVRLWWRIFPHQFHQRNLERKSEAASIKPLLLIIPGSRLMQRLKVGLDSFSGICLSFDHLGWSTAACKTSHCRPLSSRPTSRVWVSPYSTATSSSIGSHSWKTSLKPSSIYLTRKVIIRHEWRTLHKLLQCLSLLSGVTVNNNM